MHREIKVDYEGYKQWYTTTQSQAFILKERDKYYQTGEIRGRVNDPKSQFVPFETQDGGGGLIPIQFVTFTRKCHRHPGIEVGVYDYCPVCTAELENPRPVSTMTRAERLAEFDSWYGVLETKFHPMHVRLEALVGRGIMTHELALGRDGLREEILGHAPPETIEETIPEELKDRFITFNVDDPSDEGFSAN